MEPADCLSHRPYKQHTQSEEQLKTVRKQPNDTIIKKSSHIKTLLVSSRLFLSPISIFRAIATATSPQTPSTKSAVVESRRRRILSSLICYLSPRQLLATATVNIKLQIIYLHLRFRPFICPLSASIELPCTQVFCFLFKSFQRCI